MTDLLSVSAFPDTDTVRRALERLPVEHKEIVAAARDAYLGLETIDLAAYPRERAALLDHIRSGVTAMLR